MATMYPAIEATMGRWTYYIVKIKTSDLVKEVQLSSDIHQDRTLDEAIQRVVNKSRARKDLVVYLHNRDDRFFNSIVVAALGGSPTFIPLRLADTPENQAMKAMKLDQSFGVLTFAGGEKYYALDGQHRLAALRAILEPSDKPEDSFAREYISETFRQGFRDEEISVIMVVQDPGEDGESLGEVLKDYRRLFSSLNRYAKPTNQATNIIMDEDDGIAILTRRLISEHEFFKWTVDNPSEYLIVKTDAPKALKDGDPYFTQIEVLYDINQTFLSSAVRSAKGWKLTDAEVVPQKRFEKIWKISRPDEGVLEEYFAELCAIWDGLLVNLPDLRRPPTDMRTHNPSGDKDEADKQDSALFWPICQYVLAGVARELLDEYSTQKGIDTLNKNQIVSALEPISRLDWSLHSPPWRYLLLVQSADKAGNLRWKMRDEDRSAAIPVAQDVIEFIVGITQLDALGEESLKKRWLNFLVPIPDEKEGDRLWEIIRAQATS